MENNLKTRKKKNTEKNDENPNTVKRVRHEDNENAIEKEYTAGKVKKIRLRNFMCHEALEITLNENVNFIVGRNGSGKSAILTALTVGLGARANVTSRGTSVKEFVKKGRSTATIEITLMNKGNMTYKPDIYGDTITVIRTIGTTSSYKIKNWRGEIISTKRDDVDSILTSMNIQVDNPISILNQDISRTFLVNSKPEEKYNLFTKATLLDGIENNYSEALKICEEEYEKLKQYYETISTIKTEIEELKKKICKLEEVDETREKVKNFEMELEWAVVIKEENKLRKLHETLNMYKDNLKKLENVESSVETINEEIDEKIKEVKQKIQQAEQEVMDGTEAYNGAKEKYLIANENYSNKQRELRAVVNKISRFEVDINLLKKEIQNIENPDNENYNNKKEMTERLSMLEEKLNKFEASLRTKEIETMHLDSEKAKLSQEIQFSKNKVDSLEIHIFKLKKELRAFDQQSDNALSVFGANIPRLLKRIEEEYKKGRFKEKPRGPIGAYIKMRDAAWAPAVENYLGVNILNAFCVDNSQEAKLLNSIIKEIFYNERSPQIIASKFYYQVHDVRRYSVKSLQYSNLLEEMIIADPVVANCLIDQCEIECVLLIPTNEEACEVMSDKTKVPTNCKKAFTQRGDLFYPDPNYRSYGGRCRKHAKFLQVSTVEAMQTLKEELQSVINEKQEVVEKMNVISEKLQFTKSELHNVSGTVDKLKLLQKHCKESIDNLKDEIESSEATSANVFRNEASELEKMILQEKATEKILAEDIKTFQKNVESLNEEVKRCRYLRHNLHTVIDPLKDQIKELTQEKERHRLESQRAIRKLQKVRQSIQCATGEFEVQERATSKVVSNATEKCPRINTTRSTGEIKSLLNDLRDEIREVEQQFGSLNDLREQLSKKEEKFGNNIKFTDQLKRSCEKHINRVQHRQKVFEKLKKLYSYHIQKSFGNILHLRDYKGSIEIDHANKALKLNVSTQKNKGIENNTRSLSGGERSYSTVAFILALWEYVRLPFYFLDEFDVFMDKVNRRVIMDILLDHTKSHPESQFVFLTPLDTSHILAEDYITIHQLQPPERRGLTQ